MDKTEQYIEMCVKLPSEIKKHVPRDHHGSAGGDKSFFGYSKKLNGMVWLPRQDQLQDMLKEIYLDPLPRKLAYAFWNWIARTSPKYDDSMEQLWLAFVMHEKFNKKWNESEWIKQ